MRCPLRLFSGPLFAPSTEPLPVDTTLHLIDPPTGPGQLPGAPGAFRGPCGRLAELRNLRPSRPHSARPAPLFTAPTSHPSSLHSAHAPLSPAPPKLRAAPPPLTSPLRPPADHALRRLDAARVQRAAARAARRGGPRGGAGDGDEVGGDAVPRPARGARRLDAGRRRLRPARLLDRFRAVLPALVPARGGDQARPRVHARLAGLRPRRRRLPGAPPRRAAPSAPSLARPARRARARSATSTRTPRTTRR